MVVWHTTANLNEILTNTFEGHLLISIIYAHTSFWCSIKK